MKRAVPCGWLKTYSPHGDHVLGAHRLVSTGPKSMSSDFVCLFLRLIWGQRTVVSGVCGLDFWVARPRYACEVPRHMIEMSEWVSCERGTLLVLLPCILQILGVDLYRHIPNKLSHHHHVYHYTSIVNFRLLAIEINCNFSWIASKHWPSSFLLKPKGHPQITFYFFNLLRSL